MVDSSKLLSNEELMQLSKSGPIKWVNFILFTLMWLSGIYLNLYLIKLDSSFLRNALLGIGCFIIATALNAFFLILHEGCHGLIFRNKFINRVISNLFSFPYFMSFNAYRTIHLTHHNHLGTDQDPDNYNSFTGNPKVVLILQLVRLTCAAFLYLFTIPVISWKLQNQAERKEMLQEYLTLTILTLILLYFVPIQLLIVTVFLPLIPLNFYVNIRGLTQHTVTESMNPLLASRSVRCNRFVTFFYMNENYHLEHHLYPNIPCDRLIDLKNILENRWDCALTAPSYTWFLIKFFKALWKMDNKTIGIIETNSRSMGHHD